MSDNKNNFDFNFGDIDFYGIGESIKNSVNNTLKKFTEGKDKDQNLPQTRNKEVCEQKPPELSKAKGWQAASILAGLILIPSTIASVLNFFTFGGIEGAVISLFLIALTLSFPYISWKASKEYYRLSQNYVRFLRELGNNTVISVRDLASAVAQTEEKTVLDLTKMMKRGYFHQARIVEDDSLFILDIPTFRLYKEKKKEIPEARVKTESEDEVLVEDLSLERAREILDRGKVAINEIKTSQAKINDANFKSNVDKLLKNATDILNIVEKYPEKSYALNKFGDYYLPTTAKLVETYYDFEMMRTDDSKILNSMNQINESITTIGEAFDKIKVELLSDRAMDIKTDIDTINLLLNQEGYTEDDWSKE
ncbi:5-bromo-4-chloroindolyl phosphate hydrolysis family protein [Anaerococcus cruorum]|uniref:5-bromo-4-chloroindolyl phosphate hydrolysis family protein n=1 Tax=Anaerococcus cruorum TaxID=3115617 RepID=A0ABW9MVD3_9FIRM